MPAILPIKQLASELRQNVFGPGTELYDSFTEDQLAADLEFVAGGAFGGRPGQLLNAYGFTCSNVPEFISHVAGFDEYSLRNVDPSPDRLERAHGLRERVASLLKEMPERYEDLCPSSVKYSASRDLYAVVLLIAGSGQGPADRSLRIEPDTDQLLDGENVRVQRPTGSRAKWKMELIVTRGFSLSQAKEFESNYAKGLADGPSPAFDEIHAIRVANELLSAARSPTPPIS